MAKHKTQKSLPDRKPRSASRSPMKFKAFCQKLTMGKHSQRALRKIFRAGAKHPDFMNALKWASSHGYGLPQAHLDLTSKGKSLEDLVGAANAKDDA